MFHNFKQVRSFCLNRGGNSIALPYDLTDQHKRMFFGKGKFEVERIVTVRFFAFRHRFVGILRSGRSFGLFRVRILIGEDDLIDVFINVRDRQGNGFEIIQGMDPQIFVDGDSFFVVYNSGINGDINIIYTKNVGNKLRVINAVEGIGILRRFR